MPPQQFQQQQQLQMPPSVSANNPPLWPQIPVQSNPNPNNKGAQQVETLNLPAYGISTLGCNELNLRSGRVVNAKNSPIIIEQIDNEFPESEPEKEDR
jgi:hypothetical protein